MTAEEAGERFVRALATRDGSTLLDALHPDVDFRGLTPGREWRAPSASALVDDVLLGSWFEPSDRVVAVESVEHGEPVGDRQRVGYRFRVENPDGTFVVEQQAYVSLDADGRIAWLRVLCSGFRPVAAAGER